MKSRIASVVVTSALIGGLFLPLSALAADPPAVAEAEAPLVRLYDTGDHVAVVVRGAMADVENVKWRWGKMHVPIDVGPAHIFAMSSNDPTVKRVAVIGGESPRVMVLLRHADKTAKMLTEAAEIEAVEGGFRILIPRKETLFPPPAPVVAAAPAVVEPVEPAAPAVVEAAAPAATTVTPPDADQTAVTAATVTPPLPILPPPANPSDETSLDEIATASTQTSQAAWMGVMTSLLLLAACGGALVWHKRRTVGGVVGTKFEVLGNQALGGKSRLVLLGLGDRRMLLTVGEGGTTLVDKWNIGEAVAVAPMSPTPAAPRIDRQASSPLSALEFDAPRGDLRIASEPAWLGELRGEPAANDDGDPPDAESSAVTGLLELRRRGRARQDGGRAGAPVDEDRWVEALAAQLRAGDA